MQLKLRLYNQDDVQFMKNLWVDSFEDSRERVDRFFETVLPDSYGIIGEYYHKRVAAFYLIPAMIGKDRALFMFAAAVDPAYRERAIMTTILKRLFQWGEENQYWIFFKCGDLNSSRAGVHNPMEKALYYNCTVCQEPKSTPTGVKTIVKDISDEEYIDLRNQFSGGRRFPRWTESFMKFGLQDFRKAGGKVVRIKYGYANFAALITSVKGCLVLAEAVASEDSIKTVLPHLAYRYNKPLAAAFSASGELKKQYFAGYIRGYGDKKYSYFYH